MCVTVEYKGEAFIGTFDPETHEINAWRNMEGDGGRMHISARCNHDGKGEALRITPAPSFWERLRKRLGRSA